MESVAYTKHIQAYTRNAYTLFERRYFIKTLVLPSNELMYSIVINVSIRVCYNNVLSLKKSLVNRKFRKINIKCFILE